MRSFFLSLPLSPRRSEQGVDPFAWLGDLQASEAAGTWLIDMDLVSALGAAHEKASAILAAAKDDPDADRIGSRDDAAPALTAAADVAAAEAFLRAFDDPGSFSQLLYLLSDAGDDELVVKPDTTLPSPTTSSPDPGDAVITLPPQSEAGPTAETPPTLPDESDIPEGLLPARLPKPWVRFGLAAEEEGGARYSLEMPLVDDKTLMGEVSLGTLGADIEALIGDGLVGLGQSRLVAASSGDLAGRFFMVFENNGEAGYQAGQDEVFLVAPGLPPPDLNANPAGL